MVQYNLFSKLYRAVCCRLLSTSRFGSQGGSRIPEGVSTVGHETLRLGKCRRRGNTEVSRLYRDEFLAGGRIERKRKKVEVLARAVFRNREPQAQFRISEQFLRRN